MQDLILQAPKERHEAALKVLQETVTLYPSLKWEIGFSGGKDSSIICHLMFKYVEKALAEGLPLPPKIYVMYSDTLLDLPILRRHTLQTLKKMGAFAKQLGDLIEVKIVRPEQDHDYFSLLIERGYPAPHFRFRWCMDRLKMEPSVDFLETIGEFCMITGVRRDESKARKQNMAKRMQTEPISKVGGKTMVAPLFDWSQEEVWTFLSTEKQPWNGKSYDTLFEIYRLGDNMEGCGRCAMTPNSRFGCWVCTVVSKDRLLTNFAAINDEYKVMLQAKEKIRTMSMDASLRIITPEGKYKGFNDKGKHRVAAILAEVLVKSKSAMEAYLEDPELRTKMSRWLNDARVSEDSEMLDKALKVVQIAGH